MSDANGNPISGATVTFAPPGSGASATIGGGNTAMTNASGLATSGTLTANTTAGAYNVTASAPGTTTATFSETNNPGAATKLTFTTQPAANANIQATGTGTFNVSVAEQDANNNTETGDNATTVTLAINNNPSGGVLTCTNTGGLTVTVASGVANFTGCAITKTGTGYTLTATSNPAHTATGQRQRLQHHRRRGHKPDLHHPAGCGRQRPGHRLRHLQRVGGRTGRQQQHRDR